MHTDKAVHAVHGARQEIKFLIKITYLGNFNLKFNFSASAAHSRTYLSRNCKFTVEILRAASHIVLAYLSYLPYAHFVPDSRLYVVRPISLSRLAITILEQETHCKKAVTVFECYGNFPSSNITAYRPLPAYSSYYPFMPRLTGSTVLPVNELCAATISLLTYLLLFQCLSLANKSIATQAPSRCASSRLTVLDSLEHTNAINRDKIELSLPTTRTQDRTEMEKQKAPTGYEKLTRTRPNGDMLAGGSSFRTVSCTVPTHAKFEMVRSGPALHPRIVYVASRSLVVEFADFVVDAIGYTLCIFPTTMSYSYRSSPSTVLITNARVEPELSEDLEVHSKNANEKSAMIRKEYQSSSKIVLARAASARGGNFQETTWKPTSPPLHTATGTRGGPQPNDGLSAEFSALSSHVPPIKNDRRCRSHIRKYLVYSTSGLAEPIKNDRPGSCIVSSTSFNRPLTNNAILMHVTLPVATSLPLDKNELAPSPRVPARYREACHHSCTFPHQLLPNSLPLPPRNILATRWSSRMSLYDNTAFTVLKYNEPYLLPSCPLARRSARARVHIISARTKTSIK